MKLVYTIDSKCEDCYKCVRYCPVKSIEIKDGIAQVIQDKCISCGTCIQVCPQDAKKFSHSISAVEDMLRSSTDVYISLAPSFITEFRDCSPKQLVTALLSLGFKGVSETAVGATILSKHIAKQIDDSEYQKIFISRACPVADNLIRSKYPKLVPCLTEVSSPLIAHASLIKKIHPASKVVFIGPCIAKKEETYSSLGLVDEALTFIELDLMFKKNKINLKDLPESEFISLGGNVGRIYPLDGGMNKTISSFIQSDNVLFINVSGVELLEDTLNNLTSAEFENKKVFLELLYCSSGCINGPAKLNNSNPVVKTSNLIDFAKEKHDQVELQLQHIPIIHGRTNFGSESIKHSSEEINSALLTIGKRKHQDHLNCGGCGYFTCKNFAEALLSGIAEPQMCVSYMKKLANNKANELMKRMPNGVVTVDKNLCIIDSNHQFAAIVGGEFLEIFNNLETLERISLKDAIPFYGLFESVLDSSHSLEKRIKFKGKILNVIIFPIETGSVVGAIIQDVTAPIGQGQQIIAKTEEVIKKNLKTVQQIAYILGENAAESEVILNSIIESFGVKDE